MIVLGFDVKESEFLRSRGVEMTCEHGHKGLAGKYCTEDGSEILTRDVVIATPLLTRLCKDRSIRISGVARADFNALFEDVLGDYGAWVRDPILFRKFMSLDILLGVRVSDVEDGERLDPLIASLNQLKKKSFAPKSWLKRKICVYEVRG